jgi:hypothetical protein
MRSEYRHVKEFREQFSEYADAVRTFAGSYPTTTTPHMVFDIEEHRDWLLGAYGPVSALLREHEGASTIIVPAAGFSSRDFPWRRDPVWDAISGADDSQETLVAALRQLDFTLGRMRSKSVQISRALRKIHVLAILLASVCRSLVGKLLAGQRWLFAPDHRKPLLAVVGAAITLVIGAIVSGWATAYFAQHPFP